MRSRYTLVDALARVNTEQAVRASLDHVLGLLDLSHRDTMMVRSKAPSLFLRLGRGQDCYDFCKFWTLTAKTFDHDLNDLTLPFFDLSGENVFESVGIFNPNDGSEPAGVCVIAFTPKALELSHAVAIMLLKIRLLLDLEYLQQTKQAAGSQVPLDNTSSRILGSIVNRNRQLFEREDLTLRIQELKTQVKQLYDAVGKANKSFWPAMLNPEDYLFLVPDSFMVGDEMEMETKLQECYNAWVETPGAIGVIEELSKA